MSGMSADIKVGDSKTRFSFLFQLSENNFLCAAFFFCLKKRGQSNHLFAKCIASKLVFLGNNSSSVDSGLDSVCLSL